MLYIYPFCFQISTIMYRDLSVFQPSYYIAWSSSIKHLYPIPPCSFLQGWILVSLSGCFLPCGAWLLPSGLNSGFLVWMSSTLRCFVVSPRVEFRCKIQDNEYLLLYNRVKIARRMCITTHPSHSSHVSSSITDHFQDKIFSLLAIFPQITII